MSEIYYPKCWALVSGGKDSLTTAQTLHEAGKLAGCVALETGICTPDWKDFVIKTCQDRKWPLEFYATSESYVDLVQKYGFPGPGKHGLFMNYLKGRCIRKFRKVHPDAVLASGVRPAESKRRLIHTKPVSFWEGAPILAPIYHMTTDAVWAMFLDRGFVRSPAYATLQISGDCLCGAMADEGEDDAVDFHYPAIGELFSSLGSSIMDKFPTRWKWGWGWKQPKKKKPREAALCVECGDTVDLFPGTIIKEPA